MYEYKHCTYNINSLKVRETTIESDFYDIDSTGFIQVLLKKASLKITLSRSSVNF